MIKFKQYWNGTIKISSITMHGVWQWTVCSAVSRITRKYISKLNVRNFKQKDAEGLLEYLFPSACESLRRSTPCLSSRGGMGTSIPRRVSLKKYDFIIGDVFALRENEDTYNGGVAFQQTFSKAKDLLVKRHALLDYLFREAGALLWICGR